MLRVFFLSLLMAAGPITAATAQEKKQPFISGELSFELENDWAYKSDDRANQYNDLYATIEPSVTIRLAPSWSIFAHGVLEPVTDPDQFENRVFGDHGLYLEDLYLEYASGPFDVRAGKLNAGFGIAWDKASQVTSSPEGGSPWPPTCLRR